MTDSRNDPGKEPVLVTGASGFIGGALTRALLAQGTPVRALVRSAARGGEIAAHGAELVIGDLTDPAALERAAAGCATVFHVGAALGGPASVQYAINVSGTARLVEAAHTAGVRRLVHVSSIAAYGYNVPGQVTEDTPLRPALEFYGQSKAIGEQQVLRRAAELGLEAVAIRPGMVYGPRSGFWTVQLFRLVRRPPALIPASGDATCPLIYIDDVVSLLLAAAQHPNAAGEAFNAVSDEPVTWPELFGAYAAMAGHQVLLPIPLAVLRGAGAAAGPLLRLLGNPYPVREMLNGLLARRCTYSMDKAARLLGWRPRVRLAEGMAGCARWLRQEGWLRP